MYLNFTVIDQEKIIGDGVIQVGWFLVDDKSALLYEPPYRMRSKSETKHAKSASRFLQLKLHCFV